VGDRDLKTCSTCPAFYALTGQGKAAICRARPPVVFQDKEYFRGSTRSMLFGAYPAVGTFPLVRPDDYCMEHPDNRSIFMHGGPVVVPRPAPADDLSQAEDIERVLQERQPEVPPKPGL
jgi:hypothetical protein